MLQIDHYECCVTSYSVPTIICECVVCEGLTSALNWDPLGWCILSPGFRLVSYLCWISDLHRSCTHGVCLALVAMHN